MPTIMYKAIHRTYEIQEVKALEVAQHYLKLRKNEEECCVPMWCGSLSYHRTFEEARKTLEKIAQSKIDMVKERLFELQKNVDKVSNLKKANPIEKVDRNIHCPVCNRHSVISIASLKEMNNANIELHGDETETYDDTMHSIPYCRYCA